MTEFENGIYLHEPREKITADRVTLLQGDFQALRRSHPGLNLALALDKRGLKAAAGWEGKGIEVTVLAHRGICLEKECKELLKHGFQVRVALPARLELLQDLKIGALSALDISFDLMAFDLVRPVSGQRVQFHSPLFTWEGPSVSQTLEFLHDHGIAEGKISLGIADFGVVFTNVPAGLSNSGYGQPCQGVQLEDPEIDPVTYLENNPDAQVFYTSVLGCFQSFIYHLEKGDWISFDDAKTRESKTAWARRRGLKGVFSWSKIWETQVQ